mgnify:CR=1 FL=1
MSKQNTSSKGFAPWRWLKRMFFGASKEYTLADERYDSPGKLAVKRFFRNPLAVIALTILVGMFLFVFIGPIFAPVDLTETGSEMLHVNVRPTMSLMKLPDDMKDGAVDISSRGTFTIGVSTDGNMYTWGYYTHTKDPKLNPLNIPDEVKNAKIVHAAAGTDHAVAISEDGHVYAWGAYDNGQYGWDGSMIASARKQPEELMDDNTIDASQVRQLVAGNQVTAILMEDGTIYAWGNDGLNATNLSSVIKHGKKESKLVKLAFTNDGLYGIDEDGNFVPGKSSKFNTITIQDENGQNKVVDIFEYIGNRKIVDIAATGGAIALVTDDGELIVAGMKEATPVIPEGDTIKHVSGGTRHFTLVTEQGRVYAWGQNFRKQCEVPADLQEAGAVDTVFSSGFQNYAFKDGKFVEAWGLKGYVFGTDDMGRDVFNRLMNGGKMTMTIGAVAVIVSTIIGIIVGCISGYFGGWIDNIIMRIVDVFYCIPSMPVIIIIGAAMDAMRVDSWKRMMYLMLILGFLGWPSIARLVRGQILSLREQEYVLAAQATGAKGRWIITRHLVPNCMSVIFISTALQIPNAIFTESFLSYLGLGVNAPMPSLGSLASDALNGLTSYPYRMVIPALVISLIVLSLNLFGDGLRDAFDPKLNG